MPRFAKSRSTTALESIHYLHSRSRRLLLQPLLIGVIIQLQQKVQRTDPLSKSLQDRAVPFLEVLRETTTAKASPSSSSSVPVSSVIQCCIPSGTNSTPGRSSVAVTLVSFNAEAVSSYYQISHETKGPGSVSDTVC